MRLLRRIFFWCLLHYWWITQDVHTKCIAYIYLKKSVLRSKELPYRTSLSLLFDETKERHHREEQTVHAYVITKKENPYFTSFRLLFSRFLSRGKACTTIVSSIVIIGKSLNTEIKPCSNKKNNFYIDN